MTPAQEQPIWVQDLMAWLENIQAQNMDGKKSAAIVEEVLAELPGQGLPEEYWVKAKESAEAMSSDQPVELETESLSDEDRDRIYQELERAREIEDGYEYFRAEALAAVAAQLPASERQSVLEAALDAAKAIHDERYRAPALATVAAQIPASEPQLLEAALEAGFKIENKSDRINALSGVAFHATELLLLQSPPSQTSTLLEIIPRGQTSADKAKLLSALAPRLSSGLFPRALQLIQTEITHPAYQAEALSNLAPYLPTEQLSEALTLVQQPIVG